MKNLLSLLLVSFCILAAPPVRGEEGVPPYSVARFRAALPVEGEREVDALELLELQRAGGVFILDVRSAESFARRHLAGSVNIPLTELTEHTLKGALPDKTKTIVLACDYSFAPTRLIAMTMQAYPVLKEQGYSDVRRLNLWHGKGGEIVPEEDIGKMFRFEGVQVSQLPVQSAPKPPAPEEPLFCTMDAKMCPDGSYVGRTGPKCEFAPCKAQ